MHRHTHSDPLVGIPEEKDKKRMIELGRRNKAGYREGRKQAGASDER